MPSHDSVAHTDVCGTATAGSGADESTTAPTAAAAAAPHFAIDRCSGSADARHIRRTAHAWQCRRAQEKTVATYDERMFPCPGHSMDW
eukprot:365800-Chlamydomonas_euryale.AAC.23